jgi:hypothetical protein
MPPDEEVFYDKHKALVWQEMARLDLATESACAYRSRIPYSKGYSMKQRRAELPPTNRRRDWAIGDLFDERCPETDRLREAQITRAEPNRDLTFNSKRGDSRR